MRDPRIETYTKMAASTMTDKVAGFSTCGRIRSILRPTSRRSGAGTDAWTR
jgi:hypothetical protein